MADDDIKLPKKPKKGEGSKWAKDKAERDAETDRKRKARKDAKAASRSGQVRRTGNAGPTHGLGPSGPRG